MGKIDVTRIHESFKCARFRAVNVADLSTGKVKGYRVLFKRPGEKYWKYIGDEKGPLEYQTEQEAQEDAQLLRDWSKGMA